MKLNKLVNSEPSFIAIWDMFTQDNMSDWRYMSIMREYQREYSGSRLVRDMSFTITSGEVPVCICPLFLESKDDCKSFSLAGGYDVAPIFAVSLDPVQRKKVMRYCFEIVEGLACENQVDKCMMEISPQNCSPGYNFLQSFGYFDTSECFSMIDLHNPLKEIWTNMRKSCKWRTNKSMTEYDFTIIDYNNPDYALHEAYREMHHKAAGRVTRSRRTFELMYEMLKQDKATLVCLTKEEELVAMSYFLHFNNTVYYASSADDPEFDATEAVGYAIIWRAIEYYHARAFHWFETGVQQYGPQFLSFTTPKDCGISTFKRGFGGNVVPLFRGIRYYNPGVFARDVNAWSTFAIESLAL